MLNHIDETRRAWLVQIARKTFVAVAVIAIGAVVDVIPEKIAELAVWVGIAFLLMAAVAPSWLLKRALEQHPTHPGAEGEA